MALKPFGLRKVICPTLPSSRAEPRRRRTHGSVGPPQLIRPTPSMTPNTISLFSAVLRLKDKKAPARPDIWSRQIRFSPERSELDTSAGAGAGQPATGCSVVRKRSGRSWRSTRWACAAIRRRPFRIMPSALTGSSFKRSMVLLRARSPEAIDELDPLQRGSLIHEVQFNLFARLRADGLLPVRPTNLVQAQQSLDVVIAEVAARYRDDLAPAIDRVWEDGVASIRADLREWLRRASEDDSGYVPWRFELSFGLEHRSRAAPGGSAVRAGRGGSRLRHPAPRLD